MWLISETTQGCYLEYWSPNGVCLCSFDTNAPLEKLDQLKALLKECGVMPKIETRISKYDPR